MDILAKLPPEKSLAIRRKLFASIAAGERPDIDAIFREAPEIDVSAFQGPDADYRPRPLVNAL